MSLIKKSIKNKPITEEQPKRFVSDEGVYLQNDSMGDYFKKCHELIKQTIFLPKNPTPPSTSQ